MAAGLNMCGYDEGLQDSAPVRQQVRDEINKALAASEDARKRRDDLCLYIAQHRMTGTQQDIAQYISLSLYLSPPPKLETTVELAEMPPDATQVADVAPLLRNFAAAVDLHGIWLAPADVKDVENATLPSYQAGMDLGIKPDGEGVYDVFARDPQSALTPKIQVVKQNGSTFLYNGSSAAMMILARREAKLQGANSVKLWACHQGCYDHDWLVQGGSDVEGTHSMLLNLPFYTEYKSSPPLASLAKTLGGPDKVNSYGVSALIAALMFQDAARKAVAGGGTLTRQSLFDALKNTHDFDAQGLVGPVDIGNHATPHCIVVTVVKDGKWVREYPKKAGTFDCSTKNVATVKRDAT